MHHFLLAGHQESSVVRPVNDQGTIPRGSSLPSSSNKQPAPAPPASSAARATLPAGARLCILQPSAERTAGFALSGKSSPPYLICQIEKNSPAEQAGLRLNDALLSINSQSVAETTYEETVKLIKEALKQPSVELVVRESSSSEIKEKAPSQDRLKMGSQSSASEQAKASLQSSASANTGSNGNSLGGGGEPTQRGTNAVEEYQSMSTDQ